MKTGKSKGCSSSRIEKEELLEAKGVMAFKATLQILWGAQRWGRVEKKVKELGSMPQCSTLDFSGWRSTKSWAEAVVNIERRYVRPAGQEVVGSNFLGP